MKKLEVIVPVLNEENSILELISRIDSSLKDLGISYGIIFVDDHSSDGTKDKILSASEKYPIKYLVKSGMPGKAYSILEGAAASDAEYLVMIDGDLQYPPEAIPEMLSLAESKKAGVIVANRQKSQTNPLRKLVSKVSRFVVGRLIMGFPCDIQSGLKLFRRNIAMQINENEVTAWAFDATLLSNAKEMGYGMGCINIIFEKRKSGKSKVSIISGSFEIFGAAVRQKFRKRKIFHIEEGSFIYKSKKFTTHTNLSESRSAFLTFTFTQKAIIFLTLFTLIAGLFLFTMDTSIIFISILSAIYFLDLFFGLYLVLRSLRRPPEIELSPKDLESLTDKSLPIYTIMCPLYKEARVLPNYVKSMEALDYPKNKLEVLLLLEEDDEETIDAARKMNLPGYFKIVVVPDSQPKTKPKACNYGLMKATGEYVVIYDAEDRPEPLQLKKAFLGFKNSPSDVFCLQAKLNYYNPHQNLLTRLFTAEYSLWFDVILPGLQSIQTTIPLGGTSNHFRTQALRDIKGWDAFNVTEDADLGIRLFKAGYKTAIFNSMTLEEANSNTKNWIRQRSRWIKGYLQTYLVHTRDSFEFAKTGKSHFFIFQLVSGLRISFMLINPFLWAMTVAYFTLYRFVGPQIEALFPSTIFYIAMISAVFGNFLYLYYYMIGAAKRGQWSIIKYIFLIPFYWLLASIGAFMAVYQLIFKPHFWEKTVHGLDLDLTVKEKKGIARFVNSKFGLKLNKDYVAGAFLVASALITDILNFLYNAYLGRRVSLEDFGLIGLVGSLVYITSIPLSALSRTVTFRSGFLFGKYKTYVKEYWKKIRGQSIKFSFIFAGIWLLLTPFLTHLFKSDTILPFIIFVPVWIFGIVGAVDSGFLSGNLLFVIVGIDAIVESLTKLALSVFLVSLGLHEWVYIAIPASMFVSFGFVWLYIINMKPKKVELEFDETKFSGKFFVSSIANKISSIAFLSLDIIAAKAFLSPDDAGRYTILSLAGKMVFAIGSLFSGFITPIVSKNEGAGVSSDSTFYKILGATTGAGALAFVAFGLFGWFTAPILFGSKTASIIEFLPVYTFAILLQTIAVAIVNFHQVKDRHLFSYLGFLFSMTQIGAMVFIHRGISDIVWAMAIGGALYLFSMVFLHFYYQQVKTVISNLLDFLGIFALRQPVPEVNPTGLPRILILNWRDTKHSWAGGAEVHVQELAKRLVKRGYKVTIFCGNDGKSPRNEKIDNVQIIRRGGFYTVYLWAFLYYVLRLNKYVDVVIDCENGIPFFTPIYSSKKIFLLIFHVHQEVFRIKLKPPMSWIGKILEKNIMPLVYKKTEIMTVSPSTKTAILEHKLTKKDPFIVYSGIDINIYKPKVKAKNPTVLYVGRLTPQKSVDVLVRAAQKIIDSVPQVEIIIAGDGMEKNRLMKLTNKLGLEKKIKFTGKITEEEKIVLYQKAWVFVNPSLVEGWGITNIEANACGTPIVASNVSGLRDAVKDKETGILVPYGNVEQFAENVIDLLKNNKVRGQLGKKSIAWAKNFDWEISTQTLIAHL